MISTKTCKVCNNSFDKKKNISKKNWEKVSCCSMECRNKYLSIIKKGILPPNVDLWNKYKREIKLHTCAGCGIDFQYRKELKGSKTKYCTIECAKRYWIKPTKGKVLEHRRGENHHNWKGGVSSQNHIIRNSLEYKEWRRKVYERDDYTCVICNKKGVKLNADHIKPFCLFIELRFDLDNGRTLCLDCHKEHGWSLFKENNPRKKQNLYGQENS